MGAGSQLSAGQLGRCFVFGPRHGAVAQTACSSFRRGHRGRRERCDSPGAVLQLTLQDGSSLLPVQGPVPGIPAKGIGGVLDSYSVGGQPRLSGGFIVLPACARA